jgi:hypothetical protein
VNKPALIAEKANDLTERPILVVDKNGLIGKELVKHLKNYGIVVYVSKEQPLIDEKDVGNIIHIPFFKKIPSIPENNYSFIFVIDDGDVLRESVFSFLKKAEDDKSSLIFVTSLFNTNEKLIAEIKNNYRNSKIIIHGDVFSSLTDKLNSPVNNLIYEATRYGRIELPGDGTKLLYPINIDNLAKGILETAFGSYKDEKIFYLFLQNGITYLSFAHLLQKNNPWLKIDFVKEKKGKELKISLGEGNYDIGKNNNLEENLKEISLDEDSVLQEKGSVRKDKKKSFSKHRVKKFPFLIFIFFLFLLLTLPLIATFSLSILGAILLQDAKNNFSSGSLSFALNQAKISQKTFKLASYSIKPLEYELSFIGKKNYAITMTDKIETGKNISGAAIAFFNASNSFVKVAEGKTKRSEEEFVAGVNSIKNAIAMLQKEINKETPLGNFDKKIEKSLNFISSTIDLWPTLVGFDGKKTYLILLQNNMELRPGGGFIGSYGILTMDKGRVSDFQINDVYNADGQLKAHVEPQFPLRRHLAVKHLFLRDSNFDLDFRNVASQAAMLFNLETGKKINGVIGVDLSVVKNILNSIGEVEIVDYKEKVNAENLFYITESHVEKGFFPGSTQKKDFLRSLYSTIVSKLSQKQNISYLSLLDGLVKSIEEKHLLFGFSNPGIQNIFTVNDWSSALWDKREETEGKINDFLGISEANFGGNKVNYFISRSVSQRVSISNEGNINEELTILYKNDSNGQWPGGDYKNYLRLILPKNTTIQEIKIDDQKQKIIDSIMDPAVYEETNFKPPSGLEIEKNEESGKAVFGFLTIIPKGKLVKITIVYELLKKINIQDSSFVYDLRIFKQPGVDSFPYDLVVEQPEGYRVLEKSEGVRSSKNKEMFGKNIVKDEDLFINLVKE